MKRSINFSIEELSTLEALEIKGGKGEIIIQNTVAQCGCLNTVLQCACTNGTPNCACPINTNCVKECNENGNCGGGGVRNPHEDHIQ